ncbi:hypothetical protein A3Q56_06691 [Intoshia linei]|uniref:Uncharacterized protein n=1 Tax=Intoshia linei TaxID=1819745 RepID=A0A177AUD7_9BILA|nr:hypothetical protein A3Q56_06691 [Intoshia linei]
MKCKLRRIRNIQKKLKTIKGKIEDTANVHNLMIDSIDENINKQDAKNKGNEVGDKLIEPRVEKRPVVEDSLVAKIAQVKKLKEKNAYLEKQISLLKSIKNKNTTRNENIDDLNEIIKELKEKNTKLNEKNVALSSQYKMANELLTKEKITMNKTLIELSNAENQRLSLKEETKNNLKLRHEFIHHLENEKSICDVEEKNPELIIQKEPEIEQHNERFDPPPFSEIHDDNFLLIGKFNKELLNSLKRDIEQPLQLYSKIEQVLYG